jgi:hypothetical protein
MIRITVPRLETRAATSGTPDTGAAEELVPQAVE